MIQLPVQATWSFFRTLGLIDYNGTSVAAGPIAADGSLSLSMLQGGLIYELHYARSPVATLFCTGSRAASTRIHLLLNIRTG